MADYHYWIAWNGKPQKNSNGVCDYITVEQDLGNDPPGPTPSWCFHGLDGWFAPKTAAVKDVELNLCQSTNPGRPPADYFVAIVDGANKYYFKMPVVVGHRYMREMKIKTKATELLPENSKMKLPVCRYVMQDMTLGTMERVELPISGSVITLAENFIEWHNKNTPALFTPRFRCTSQSFGDSINSGVSWKDFTPPDSLNVTNDGLGLNHLDYLGGFVLSGNSYGPPSAGNPSGNGASAANPVKYAGNIQPADIHFYYSGGLGNSEGDFSLGGGPSMTEVPTYMLNNLFGDLSEGEAKDGSDAGEYRCLYARNINQKEIAAQVSLWSPTGGSVSPDTFIYFGMGTAPLNGVEPQIAAKDAAPPGVKFAEYHSYDKGMPVEDMPPGSFRSFWIWRKHRANTRTFSRDQAIVEANYYPPVAEEVDTAKPVCPEGYLYDPNIKMCVRQSGGVSASSAFNGHGVKLMYATLGGDRFFELMRLNQSNINQIKFKLTVKEFSGTSPNVVFKLGSGVVSQVRIDVGTKKTPMNNFNDKTMIDNLDTAFLARRGYMCKDDDWRNYEATWYLLVHKGGSSSSNGGEHCELEGRCGHNSTDSTKIGSPPKDRSCESTKYNFNCYNTGRVKFEKCIMHSNGYSKSNPEVKNALNPSNFYGKWTGFKEVVYNIPGSSDVKGVGPVVKIEGYVDQGNNATTPSNQWKKVIEAIDDGSGKVFSGPRATYTCGSWQTIPVSWGGPIMVFRWDYLDAEFKWLSMYELDPKIKPGGTGGGADMLPPTWVGGNTPGAIVVVGSKRIYYAGIARSTVGDMTDRMTVGLSAQLIGILVNPQYENPGTQITIGNTNWDVAGYCAGTWGQNWVYGRYGSPPEDVALMSYWDDWNGVCIAPGAGSMSTSKSGGRNIATDYYGPKLTDAPFIFVIFWGKEWNTRTTAPTKQQLEIKIRDYMLNRDVKNYFSRLNQYGILQPPRWGKSCVNTTTPIPKSPAGDQNVMQCVHDSIQRGDVDSPNTHKENCIYFVICSLDLAQVTDPYGTPGSSYHNYYDYDSSSNYPGHHDASGGSTSLFKIYGMEGPDTGPRALYSGSMTRYGWLVTADSIMLAQDPLTQIGFYLKKQGAPTGPIFFRIRDASNAIKVEFGVLDAASDVTNQMELAIIRNETNDYILQPGDKILIEYTGGSSTNHIKVDEILDNNSFEGPETCAVSYTGTTWTTITARMPAGELWTGFTGTADIRPGTNLGGGTVVEPEQEPDVVVFDVGSTNTPNNMYTGSIVRCAQTIKTTSSLLFGKVPARIGFWMSIGGAPTGTVYCRIRNGADAIVADFGSININLVGPSPMQLHFFDNFQNTYALQVNDRICIEYNGGNSTDRLRADEVGWGTAAAPNYDLTNSVSSRYITGWTDYNNNDMCFKIWTFQGNAPPPPPQPQPEPTLPEPDTTVFNNIPSSATNTPINISGATSHYQRYGVRVNTADSIILGAKITEIRARMRKVGNPTGTMALRIRDSASNVQQTFTSTFDVATLQQAPSGLITYTWQRLNNTYALQQGDRIIVEYSGGDANNYIQMDRTMSGGPDSTNTCATYYQGTSWTVLQNEDPAMRLLTTGQEVRPPPPPPPSFTTRYEVPLPSTSSRLAFSSTQRIQGQYIDTGSSLIGRKLTRLTFWVNRWSRGSGNLIATIRSSTNAVLANFGSRAISSLTNNDQDQPVVFTNTSNQYVIKATDFICIEHDNANGQIDGCRGTNSVANSWVKWNNGSSSWGQSTSSDYVAVFETGGA